MSKRSISYVKPQDPSFLAKLKAQIQPQDTVDAKRQKRFDSSEGSDDDDLNRPDLEDEKPQVVVLREGDLTAEEAAREAEIFAKEAAEKPADLNQRIVFKSKAKRTKDTAADSESSESKAPDSKPKAESRDKRKETKEARKDSSKKGTATVSNKKLLSFDNEADEEGEDN